ASPFEMPSSSASRYCTHPGMRRSMMMFGCSSVRLIASRYRLASASSHLKVLLTHGLVSKWLYRSGFTPVGAVTILRLGSLLETNEAKSQARSACLVVFGTAMTQPPKATNGA